VATGYTVRLHNFQIRVQSIEAGRRLITKAVDEIEDGARDILAFGPYTRQSGQRHLANGLRRQIKYGPFIVEGTVGISGLQYPYAASVEGGARRHKIPLTPKVPPDRLYFYWRRVGRFVAPLQVNHPGQTGKAYLRIPLLVVGPKYNMKVFTYDR
jgi:hypothetical protein